MYIYYVVGHTKWSVRKLFWDIFEHFWIWGEKHNFKPCSHIELNTQNPNTIVKITIYYTKYPTMPKQFPFCFGKFRKV